MPPEAAKKDTIHTEPSFFMKAMVSGFAIRWSAALTRIIEVPVVSILQKAIEACRGSSVAHAAIRFGEARCAPGQAPDAAIELRYLPAWLFVVAGAH